ncbi:hypothetical protein L9F63_003751, partial [Diploptera punctata]
SESNMLWHIVSLLICDVHLNMWNFPTSLLLKSYFPPYDFTFPNINNGTKKTWRTSNLTLLWPKVPNKIRIGYSIHLQLLVSLIVLVPYNRIGGKSTDGQRGMAFGFRKTTGMSHSLLPILSSFLVFLSFRRVGFDSRREIRNTVINRH